MQEVIKTYKGAFPNTTWYRDIVVMMAGAKTV